MGKIYCIYEKDKPVYVGQTKKTVIDRYYEHCKTAKSRKNGFLLHHKMYSHGIDNFSVKEIEDTENLNEREKYWIEKLKTHVSQGGYNLTRGGEQSSDSLKRKCYQYDLNGNFIKEYDSISSAAKAVNGSHSNIVKALSGEINIAYNYRWFDKKVDKIVFDDINYTGRKKQVYQYDLNYNLINIFPSTKEAARQLNKSQGNISSCANKKRKTAYGYIWSYDYIMKKAGY